MSPVAILSHSDPSRFGQGEQLDARPGPILRVVEGYLDHHVVLCRTD